MRSSILKIYRYYIYIHTAYMKDNIIAEELYDNKFKNGFIQIINSEYVYNHDHIIEVLKLVFESKKRKIMFANKMQVEFLIRMTGINQIKKVLEMTQLKKDGFNSIVIVLGNKKKILEFKKKIEEKYGKSNNDIFRDAEKKHIFYEKMNLQNKENKFLGESNIIKYLIEIALLSTR